MTPGPPPGLCGTCAHARRVENRRGSTFMLCERSKKEPEYRKYPALPVVECGGYEGARGQRLPSSDERAETEDKEGS